MDPAAVKSITGGGGAGGPVGEEPPTTGADAEFTSTFKFSTPKITPGTPTKLMPDAVAFNAK